MAGLDDVVLSAVVGAGATEDGDWLAGIASELVTTVADGAAVVGPCPQADKESPAVNEMMTTSAAWRCVMRTVYLPVAVQGVSCLSRAKSPITGQVLRLVPLPE